MLSRSTRRFAPKILQSASRNFSKQTSTRLLRQNPAASILQTPSSPHVSFQKLTNFTLAQRWASTSVKVPQMAESLTEGSLKEFTKAVGDFIEQDELLATIETDKIDIEVIAPVSGTVSKLNFKPEDTVTVGEELATIEEGEGSASKSEAETPAPAASENTADAAPAKEEAKPAAEAKKEKAASKPSPTPTKPASKPKEEPKMAKPSFTSFSRNETRVKMNRMRMRIAERLKESQNTAASLTTFNEVDMSSLLEMRKLYKDEIIKSQGVKFGFMGLFSKACVIAAKEFPGVNGAIEGDQIVYRDYVDISVAVATPKGLVTPVSYTHLDVYKRQVLYSSTGKIY